VPTVQSTTPTPEREPAGDTQLVSFYYTPANSKVKLTLYRSPGGSILVGEVGNNLEIKSLSRRGDWTAVTATNDDGVSIDAWIDSAQLRDAYLEAKSGVSPEATATQSLSSGDASHVGSGQFQGCPILYEGQYFTDPSKVGSSSPSMDLINWAMGDDIAHVTAIHPLANGEIVVGLDSGEEVNLHRVDHLVVRVLDVPLAIETWEAGFNPTDVTPETMLKILVPGAPVWYGFPPYGSQFNVTVGCNQP
jgi:hypothetical protein